MTGFKDLDLKELVEINGGSSAYTQTFFNTYTDKVMSFANVLTGSSVEGKRFSISLSLGSALSIPGFSFAIGGSFGFGAD